MVDLAWKILVHDRLRFGITVLGVAFAVSLVLVQVGLFLGLLDNASVTIDRLGADLWVTPLNAENVDFPHTMPETYVLRVRSIPGVARADNLIVAFGGLTLPRGSQETTLIYALDNAHRWGFPWAVSEGDTEDLRRGRFIAMDDSAAQRFGSFENGDFRNLLGFRVRIVARTREARSFTTTPISFMDPRLVKSMLPEIYRGRTSYVLVKLEPGADRAAVRDELRRELPWSCVYTREEWSQQCRRYWVAVTGLGLNMYLTVFLGVLVGSIVVAQTLSTSTLEHARELATLKAMGATNADVYGILIRQALIAAFVGFGAGWLPVPLANRAIESAGLRLALDWQHTAIVFLGTTLLCVGASAVSFRRVAALDPALVLR